MYELKYSYVWIFLGVMLIGIISYLSLVPSRSLPSLNVSDKLVHFLIYLTITLWFVGIFKQKYFAALGILFLLFSLGIEILQGMTTYRSFEWLDLAANGLGIFCAVILGILMFKGWCEVIEKKLLKVKL